MAVELVLTEILLKIFCQFDEKVRSKLTDEETHVFLSDTELWQNPELFCLPDICELKHC